MKYCVVFMWFCMWCSHAQVGINTVTPNAQLDIRSSNQTSPSNTDGILIPKIDTFPATNPTAAQQGMLVYLTTTSGTNMPGFYYWDNSGTPSWRPITGSSGSTLDQAYDFGGAGIGNTITADAGALTINGTDGFISTGTFNTGAIAPSGAGVKMFWNPRKAAFRVGRITGTQWDDISIGNNSIAMGFGTIASGNASIALGNMSSAIGMFSVAFGTSANANATQSTAFGSLTNANSIYSTAFGYETRTSGQASTSFGVNNEAESFGEVVLGIGATNYTPTTNGTTQFRNANATDRLLVVGNAIDTNNSNSVDDAERSDALVILKNGLTRLPSTTNALINAADGKAVVTKEYLQGFGNGVTLDQAYDFGGAGIGNTITADAGALTINGTDGFVSTGTINTGAIAPSGAGVKMFWNPRKAAFRAGSITGTQWDDVNVGGNSTSFGFNTRASGGASTAFGSSTRASGGNSTAFGFNTIATGMGSTAFGYETNANSDISTAFGYGTTASGQYTTAFGINTLAQGNGSTAFGENTICYGIYSTAFGLATIAGSEFSTAFGRSTIAAGTNATAFGNQSTAGGEYSTAFGGATTASGFSSTSFGAGTVASGSYASAFGRLNSAVGNVSTAYGQNNVARSFGETVLGIGATDYTPSTNGASRFGTSNLSDRLLVVGNAIDSNNNSLVDFTERSDALVLLKNGNVGIGSSIPQETLHVVGKIRMVDGSQGAGKVLTCDANGTAVWNTFSATNAWGLGGNVGTTPITNFIGTSDNNSVAFRTNNIERARILATGDFGIGTNNPQEKLHISGPAGLTAIRISNTSTSGSTSNVALDFQRGGNANTDWRIYNIGPNLTLANSPDELTTISDLYQFQINRFMPMTDASQNLGQAANRWNTLFASNGTINTSDAREKKNIQNIKYGLNTLMQLRPVSFEWKKDEGSGTKLGLIAQDLQQIIPEVVRDWDWQEDEQGNRTKVAAPTLGVYYSDLIPVLIKATQEQQAMVENLKQENTSLKSENESLHEKMNAIYERLKKLEAKQN